MNELTFPLLGVLSSTEIGEDNPLEQQLNHVRECIDGSLIPVLRSSSYVAKSRLERALERCITDTATLCVLPQLLAHACIGFVEGNIPLASVLPALGPDCESLATHPLALPRLLVKESVLPRIQAFSLAGKIINLSGLENHSNSPAESFTSDEYETLIDLQEDGINPRDVVSALMHFIHLKRQNSAYLLLQSDEISRAELNKLFVQCNAIIILGNLPDVDVLKPLRDNFTMSVYIISDVSSDVQDMLNSLKSDYAGRRVDIVNPQEIDNLLDSLDCNVQRITLHDRLLSELLQVEQDICIRIERFKNLEKSLRRDSILSVQSGDMLTELLEESQKYLQKSIKKLEKEKKIFSDASRAVLAAANEMEKLLYAVVPPSASTSPVQLHAGAMRPEVLWRRIILRAIVSDKMQLAEKYQSKLGQTYPDQAFLTDLYIRKKKGVSISNDDIERLRSMPDTPETLRAKIYFHKELNLTEKDCSNIAALLPRRKDAVEKYYWACHLYDIYQENKQKGNAGSLPFAEVIEAFREAVLAGSVQAAELFAQFCGGERRSEEAQEIADMGYSAGAYISRLLSIVRGDSQLADRYLKMAAALGHPKALALSADKYWEMRLRGDTVSFDYASGSITGLDVHMVKNGISMYEYLRNQPEIAKHISDYDERLGYFYFCDKQWQQSRKYIGNAPSTAEGCFCLAVMLKYGHGGNLKKDDAIGLIRKAENFEGPFAALAHDVKIKWFAEDLSRL